MMFDESIETIPDSHPVPTVDSLLRFNEEVERT